MVIRNGDIPREIKEQIADLVRMAESMGKTVSANALPLPTLTLRIAPGAAQGWEVAYTHDCEFGIGYAVAKETCAEVWIRLPDRGRANKEWFCEYLLRDKVPTEVGGGQPMAPQLPQGAHLYQVAGTSRYVVIEHAGDGMVILDELPF